MALTEQDITNIKAALSPELSAIRGGIDALAKAASEQFIEMNQQFAHIERRFDEMNENINSVGETVTVIKEMTKDHHFRVARLEHRINPAG